MKIKIVLCSALLVLLVIITYQSQLNIYLKENLIVGCSIFYMLLLFNFFSNSNNNVNENKSRF